MKKKLDVYQGKLTAAQIAKGMNAAAENAQRLVGDATVLLDARRFPTAASLAILSIAEAGKISILRSLALARTNDEVLDSWRDYRSHTRKNVAWILPQLVAAGASNLEDFRPLFEQNSDHPYILDQVKQIGLYTDCLGKANWSSPDTAIDETLARTLVNIARILSKDSQHTEKEVQLWVEHLGPVWKKDLTLMNRALVTWYAAMQQCGLVQAGTNEMEQWIQYVSSNN
jgi:AbiV family abortive infection protein